MDADVPTAVDEQPDAAPEQPSDEQPLVGLASVRPLAVIASIVALGSFAVAQPLLDLLGRNPEFFLARAAPALDVVMVALVLVLMWVLVGLVVVVIRKVHQPTGTVLHVVILTVLGAALALTVFQQTALRSLIPDWIQLFGAIVLGATVAFGFARSGAVRSVAWFAAAGSAFFVVWFLFVTPTSQLLAAERPLANPVGVTVGNPAPVVVVVFDELPVASLIDANGNLQEELYPNLTRLASDGTWYRNAVSVRQQTEESVPSILTGVAPPEGTIPMAGDHPLTLFTLLSDVYDVQAVETVTEMCPDYACTNQSRYVEPLPQRWSSLFGDLSVIYSHLALPSVMTERLPAIDQTWGNFADDQADGAEFDIIERFLASEGGRVGDFERFLALLDERPEGPALYYGHFLLPHFPWSFLPTGQSYPATSPVPGIVPQGWSDDEWLVAQIYQRHLLQVEYIDLLLGRVIDRLDELDMYEEAVIVLVSDHGITIRPGVKTRRLASADSIGDVAAIPLFIKGPGVATGSIDDYRAETTDVLPTIADLLDVTVPWKMDGASLLSRERPVRQTSTIEGWQGPVTFGVDGSEKLEVAEHKVSLFGPNGPFFLAPPEYRFMLGNEASDWSVETDDEFLVSLDHSERYRDLETSAAEVPALITGRVTFAQSESPTLAVGVNGVIGAVTEVYDRGGTRASFQALVDPALFIDGDNQIEVFRIDGYALVASSSSR